MLRCLHQRRIGLPGFPSVSPGTGVIPLDVGPQAVEDTRDADKDGDPLAPGGVQDRGRMQVSHERSRALEQEGDEDAHGLTEHVAEREQVEDPDRLEGPGPFLVAVVLLPDRVEVGADVAMEMDDPLRFRCRPGGVDNFHHVVRVGRMRADSGAGRQVLERLDSHPFGR